MREQTESSAVQMCSENQFVHKETCTTRLNTHYVHICTVSSDVMTWNHIGTASRCIQMSLFTCSLYVRRQLVDDRWISSQHHTANTNVKSFRRRTPILKLYMKRWRRWTPLTACGATNDLSNARGCRWVQKGFDINKISTRMVYVGSGD